MESILPDICEFFLNFLVFHYFSQIFKILTEISNKFFSIHTKQKEYGFGQSLLHEDQLVFHTPPYSLHPISLQEGHEYVNKVWNYLF